MPTDNCPLIFKRDETVYGPGFAAKVEVQGRVLAVKEDDGYWFYGVHPAAVAAVGSSPDEAYVAFCEALRNSLENLAELSSGFSDFDARVRQFVSDSDAEIESEWKEAVLAVKAGRVDAAGIPRGSAAKPYSVSVVMIESPYALEAALAA